MTRQPTKSAVKAGSGARRYGDKTAEERREERRARLLEAAIELFGTVGYRGTTIEQICAEASVSTRNFYEEFGSREGLLIAAHDEINGRARLAVAEAVAQGDPLDLAGRARAGVRAYLEVMTSDRRCARIALIESVGVSQEAEAARRAAISSFVALISLEAERLAAEGVIPTRDFDLIATALAGALNGLINTWTTNPDWDEQLPAIAEEAARLVVAGLAGPELG